MLRDHLNTVWKARGVMPEELRTPEAPRFLRYLVEWFRELSMRRGSGMMAPAPISWVDMRAWSTMTETRVAGWEARALAHLDDLWREAWYAGRAKQRTSDDSSASRRRVSRSRSR